MYLGQNIECRAASRSPGLNGKRRSGLRIDVFYYQVVGLVREKNLPSTGEAGARGESVVTQP